MCGVPLARAPGSRLEVVAVSDSAGGMYAVWEELHENSAFSDVFVQHVLTDGRLAPGWPEDAFPVCTAPASQFDLVARADGLGGVVAAWTDARLEGPGGTEPRVYAQRVLADARIAPGFAVNGVRVSDAERAELDPSIAPDGSGGAYVVWEGVGGGVWIQHLSAAGTRATGWPSQGKSLGIGGRPNICSDGAGGLFVAWEQGGEIDAARIDADGDPLPGWPAGGLVACTGPEAFVARLMPDGSGGVFIGMLKRYQTPDVWLQHVTGAGSRPPGWTPEGIALCTAPGPQYVPALAPDGAGGVFAGWHDFRTTTGRVFASHIGPGGTLVPGWPADGLEVGPDTGFDPSLSVIGDGAGGVLLGLDPPGRGATVHHLAPDGTVASGWPASGVTLCPRHLLFDPALIPDGGGGALVAARDVRDTLQVNLYATFVHATAALPYRVANIFARAERGRVRLGWDGGLAPGSIAAVERLAPHDIWKAVAQVSLDSSGWSYTDRDVQEGGIYRYRLIVTDEDQTHGLGQYHLGEVRVIVPSSLALSVRPLGNPIVAEFAVTVTLPDAGATSIDVFDIAGRRVRSIRLGVAGPGRSTIRLDPARELRSGVYLIRLEHLGSIATGRAVLVR